MRPTKCSECGGVVSSRAKVCRKCYDAKRAELKKTYYCVDCGKLLTGNGNPKRCRHCAGLSENLSEETRQKMRDNHVGMMGKHVSEENKHEASERMVGNTYAYTTGSGFRIGRQFLEDADYTCERCGFRELPEDKPGKHARMNTHHIISRTDAPDKINDFSNLCCMCASCHRLYHCENKGDINIESLKRFVRENV